MTTDRVAELIKKAVELRESGMTFKQIGDILGISRQYVHMLVNYEHYHTPEQYAKHKKYRNPKKDAEYHRKWVKRNPNYYREWYANHKSVKKGKDDGAKSSKAN